MPYIDRDTRSEVAGALDELIDQAHRSVSASGDPRTEWAGLLNYLCTRLAKSLCPEQKYWAYELTAATLHGAAREFERRVIAPYEDRKLLQNGDA